MSEFCGRFAGQEHEDLLDLAKHVFNSTVSNGVYHLALLKGLMGYLDQEMGRLHTQGLLGCEEQCLDAASMGTEELLDLAKIEDLGDAWPGCLRRVIVEELSKRVTKKLKNL